MTSYHWQAVREEATEAFGKGPDAQIEARILEVFERQPRGVRDLVADVCQGVRSGRIRSGWPFLAKAVERLEEVSDVVVDDTSERDRRVEAAEQWIKLTGVHFDRADEVEDELFGHQGRLQAYAGEDVLRARMVALWEEQRPRGERAEAASEEWLRSIPEQRARVAEVLAERKRKRQEEAERKAEEAVKAKAEKVPTP